MTPAGEPAGVIPVNGYLRKLALQRDAARGRSAAGPTWKK